MEKKETNGCFFLFVGGGGGGCGGRICSGHTTTIWKLYPELNLNWVFLWGGYWWLRWESETERKGGWASFDLDSLIFYIYLSHCHVLLMSWVCPKLCLYFSIHIKQASYWPYLFVMCVKHRYSWGFEFSLLHSLK